jgi:thiol-disulfide isomerase/thioredoxin
VLTLLIDDVVANLVVYPRDERVSFKTRDGRIRERARLAAVKELLAASWLLTMSRSRGFPVRAGCRCRRLAGRHLHRIAALRAPVQQPFARLPADAVATFLPARLTTRKGSRSAFAMAGKTLVVNFWATWCPPCREEMPAFSRLQHRHAAKGVQFVGIALDSADSVRAFSERPSGQLPTVDWWRQGVELARQFGNDAQAFPTPS